MIAAFCRLCSRSLIGFAVATASAHAASLLLEAEENWVEAEVEMPAAVDRTQLRPFAVLSRPGTEYLIDESSLSVGTDRVVRFVLLVRSAGGAENLTYEGLRCASGETRIYASGRSDGSWVAMKNSAWQPVGEQGFNRPRAALAHNYLCDGPAPPRDRAEALRMLTKARRERINPMGGY